MNHSRSGPVYDGKDKLIGPIFFVNVKLPINTGVT